MTTELSGHIRFTGEQGAVSTMSRVNTAVRETAGSLGKLLTRAELSEVELGRLRRGLVTVNWAANNLKGGFETGISLMGRWMAGATALTGVMGAAANSFGNYSMKLSEVSTLLPPGVSGFKRYDDSVKALAISAGQATDVVAGGLYQAISASVPEGDIFTFMRKAADLSVGGVTDMKTSIDGLTNVMNAYGLGVGQVDRISAVYFNTMKQGKTTVGEVASNVGTLAPLAAQLGVSFEELGSAWVSLTKVGLRTAEAGTQMRAILLGMLKPTSDATKAAKEWGYTWNAATNIALLKSKGLTGALEEVKRMTGGSAERLGLLLPSVEALGGGMRLASEEGKRAFLEAMNSMPKSAQGALAIIDDAVSKMKDDVGFKMQQMKSALQVSWLEIGEGILTGLAPNLDGAVEMIASAGDRIRENATSFAKGIREGLMASGLGDTIKGLFETADQQKKWKELGAVIGRVTGEILSVLEKVVHVIDSVSTALGGLDTAATALFVGWLGVKGIQMLIALRKELALTAIAASAAKAAMGGGAAAGAAGGAAGGGAGALAMLAKFGLPGLAVTVGGLAGTQIGTRLRDVTLGETETGLNVFDPKFIGNDKAGGAMIGTTWGAATNTYKTANLGSMLQRAAAGDASARGQIYAQGFGADATWYTPAQRAELAVARQTMHARSAQGHLNQAGRLRQANEEIDTYFGNRRDRSQTERSIESIAEFGNLGAAIGSAIADSFSKTAKSVVEVTSNVKIEGPKGGSGGSRRKERGVGAAMSPKVALNNYFILTDEEDVLAIPDEFIYDMPRIRDALD